ncbi:MAG: class I SAM-dependent methyltransferase [Pontiella sp.]
MHDFNLAQMVEKYSIKPCVALDLGCGTGNNAIWLAQQRFSVLGFDISPTAIERAKDNVEQVGSSCRFQVGDFLADPPEVSLFGFIFDRGCLHSMTEPEDKSRFSAKVDSILEKDGLWLSLIGNADEPPREIGPPRMTVQEIAAVVEPHFKILSIAAGIFGDKQADPPKNWVCMMRSRS